MEGKARAGRTGCEGRGGGCEGKAKEESEAVAVNKRGQDEMGAMMRVADVAQQGVAPERGPRDAHLCFTAVARAR